MPEPEKIQQRELVENLRNARQLLPNKPQPVYHFTDFLTKVTDTYSTINVRGWDYKLRVIIHDCNHPLCEYMGDHKYPKDKLRGHTRTLIDAIPEITEAVCPKWFAEKYRTLFTQRNNL
jgi:hypothetical protein